MWEVNVFSETDPRSITSRIKGFALDQFRRLGYELVPMWRLDALPLSSTLRSIFENYGISQVIDVGANRGQYREFLRRHVGYSGAISSFEPIGQNAAYLMQQAALDPAWTIHACALGRTRGKAELNVMRSDAFSSFLEPLAGQQQIFARQNAVERVEEVVVTCLDDLSDDGALDVAARATFLKLDTQGFDLEVLAGGTRVVPYVCGIQTEVSCVPIYAGMPDIVDSLTYLKACGFQLAGMFPVSTREDLTVVEFDAVFVNPSRLTEA